MFHFYTPWKHQKTRGFIIWLIISLYAEYGINHEQDKS